MSNRGLKQKLLGGKCIKDLGGRLPLCPRNERTSSWTYRKTIDSVKIAKQKAGFYAAENQELDLVEGSTPSKTKKKIAHRGGARNVEAPPPPLMR
jgi:hypothetical protein